MQKQILEKQKLLNEKGELTNPGYATEPLLIYDRKDVGASKWRIKEWDYYASLSDRFGVSFVIADLAYSAMISAVFLDFEAKIVYKKTKLLWFVFGKLGLPATSVNGDSRFHGGGFDFDFVRNENERIINVSVKDFLPGKDLSAKLQLKDLHDDSMVIATPWQENRKAFYYNQKINCMPTSGTVTLGSEEYHFHPDTDFSVLDWGRGVWTYKNTWYWASISGIVEGKRFGMNLGYGFGDMTSATENMLFYDGSAHKLDQVVFEIQEPDFLKPWRFIDDEGRLEMVMEPIVDRQDDLNFGIIKNLGHQVFGRFSGYFVLDDGRKIEFRDQIGFAEKITNHY